MSKDIKLANVDSYLELTENENGELVMDSRAIAEWTGKRHDNVCRDVVSQLGGNGGVLRFEDTYINPQNGQKYPCYKLPYRETMILVSGYSVEIRSIIIDRWIELEKAKKQPMPTGTELIALAVIEAQKQLAQKNVIIAEQTKTITDMTPKAEFFDTVTDSKDAIAMDQAAKVIDFVGVGRNNLFAFLRDRKVLDNSNLPYQKYIDAGWFRVIETKYNTPNGDVRIYQKTLVYQRGLNAIIRSLLQHGYEKRNATAELL